VEVIVLDDLLNFERFCDDERISSPDGRGRGQLLEFPEHPDKFLRTETTTPIDDLYLFYDEYKNTRLHYRWKAFHEHVQQLSMPGMHEAIAESTSGLVDESGMS
jgi:hypothetical protein